MNVSLGSSFTSLGATTTTSPGSTAALLVQLSEDYEEIRWLVPIAQITGSPIFTAAGSNDGGSTYTNESVTWTRSSADNAKMLIFVIQKPTKKQYKLSLNLNSGTVNFALSLTGIIGERLNGRRKPNNDPNTVVIMKTAD